MTPRGKSKAKAKPKAGSGVLALLAMAGPPPPVGVPAPLPIPQTPGPALPYRQLYQLFKLGVYWCYTFSHNHFSAIFGNLRLDVRNTLVEKWRSDPTSWNLLSGTYVYRAFLRAVGFPDFTVSRASTPGVVWIANEANLLVRVSWGYGRCDARRLPGYDTRFNDPTFNWWQPGLELVAPPLPMTPVLP